MLSHIAGNQTYRQIIADGHAYCIGYVVALGGLLKREGYGVAWTTMTAADHPKGFGKRQTESHQVIEVEINGDRYVFDPMANTYFPYSIDELLRQPQLADACANRDERCRNRGYDLYNTSFWYDRVSRFARRRNLRIPVFFWKKTHFR